ncbi:MAG: hypothetical protein KF760_06695 [Candidatus Eremiobacteraeota bacterium]|nr:hypothetical protein [Candidatus Eremiobacteraeota bacterium]MCW5866054.1 hypothetical protein [Candidatus Eremiobacteraeota bacterium]
MLSAIALRRLRLLSTAPSGVDLQSKLTFLAQLAGMGYRVENPEAYNDSVLYDFAQTVEVLKEMRGGKVDYTPLFSGFPDKVPEDRAYFIDRLIGFLVRDCLTYPQGTRLENGLVVPDWLFDLKEFGADPIAQMQDPKLRAAAKEQQAGRKQDTHVEWVSLRLADFAELEERALDYLRGNLYAKSSIQEMLRPDLEWLLGHFSAEQVDPAQVVFRETRTYLSKYYWERADYVMVARLCDTPTDFLRLFAALTGGDISLAEKTSYPKLKRAQRRVVLAGLERAANLEEDLRRYRGLWLAVGRGLHPGAEARDFPRAAAAFQILRNGTIRSFNSHIEMAFQSGASMQVLEKLAERPTLLARRLQQLLKANPGREEAIFSQFSRVAGQVPLKILLQLESYFRNQWRSDYRTILNKKGKLRVVRRPYILHGGVLERVADLLAGQARAQVAARPSWSGKTCWIDAALSKYTVPFQLRKASEGMLVLGRGTRLPLDTGKVLRLFVYWKQRQHRTDLDLSLLKFDEKMHSTGNVSYTRLASEGIVHSGDLQDAPLGAAEFIDVELSVVRKLPDCRYLAPQINRFCGDYFALMDCHSGWMIRDKVDARYESFDLKTVQNKFDLTGTSGYCLPILVDLQESEILFIDLYVTGRSQHNTAEAAVHDVSILCQQMVLLGQMLPNLYDLAVLHQQARGAVRVHRPEEAEITFGLSGQTYSADRMEKILSDLC